MSGMQQTLTSLPSFESQPESKTITHILENVMVQGRYQYKVIAIFALLYCLIPLIILSPGIYFKEPTYLCDSAICSQETFNSYEGLKQIDENSSNSITKEFQLYGDRKWLSTTGQSLQFLGGVIGTLCLMPLSDSKGRKKAINLCWLIIVVANLLMACSSFLICVFIGQFLIGCGIFGIVTVISVYLSEVTTGSLQSTCVSLLYTVYSVGELMIYPMTKVTEDWRYFNLLFITLPAIIALYYTQTIIESPKFLVSKNKQETIDSLNNIFKQNGQQVHFQVEDVTFPPQNNEKSYNYLDLFKFKSLRGIVIYLTILKAGVNFIYFGIQFSLSSVGNDFATNTIFLGIGDFLGYMLASQICSRLQRKNTMLFSIFISVCFCLMLVFIQMPQDCNGNCYQLYMQLFFIMAARFSLGFVYSTLIVWTCELLPTTIKSIGSGFINSLGMLGAQLVPYTQLICSAYGINPITAFCIIAIFSSLTSLFLRETFGGKMVEEIEEIQQQQNNDLYKELKVLKVKSKNNNQDIEQQASNQNIPEYDTNLRKTQFEEEILDFKVQNLQKSLLINEY